MKDCDIIQNIGLEERIHTKDYYLIKLECIDLGNIIGNLNSKMPCSSIG